MDRAVIHSAHQTNRAKLVRAGKHLELALNASIKNKNPHLEYVHTRLSIVLWMSWFESSIAWLACHPRVSDADRESILETKAKVRKKTLQMRAATLINTAFGLSTSASSTPLVRLRQKQVMQDWVTTNLSVYIEVRNRLAHGQWAECLTFTGESTAPKVSKRILGLHKGDVLFLKALVEVTIKLVECLVLRSHEFDRRYSESIKRVDYARLHYAGDISWLLTELRKKHRPPRLHAADAIGGVV